MLVFVLFIELRELLQRGSFLYHLHDTIVTLPSPQDDNGANLIQIIVLGVCWNVVPAVIVTIIYLMFTSLFVYLITRCHSRCVLQNIHNHFGHPPAILRLLFAPELRN